MGKNVSQFIKTYKDDTQFVLCGFDTRGNITEIDRNTGQQKTRKIKPEESIWAKYENMFTDNLSVVGSDYKDILTKYDRDPEEGSNIKNEPYR